MDNNNNNANKKPNKVNMPKFKPELAVYDHSHDASGLVPDQRE